MLDRDKINKLKYTITNISKEFYIYKITYNISTWFLCEVSVKIGDIELNQNPVYGFFGWDNGIGELELLELEKQGFLKKISEIIDEDDPLEKTVEFEIINKI